MAIDLITDQIEKERAMAANVKMIVILSKLVFVKFIATIIDQSALKADW